MGFFDNLLGNQTDGLLGTPQAQPQLGISPDFIGPMPDDGQASGAMAAPQGLLQNMMPSAPPSQFESISANPNFSMALLKLSTSLMSAQGRGRSFGEGLDNGLTGFQNDIAQGNALQRQSKLDQMEQGLKQAQMAMDTAHANYFNTGGASAGGGVAGAQAKERMAITGEDYPTALYAVQNKLPIPKVNMGGIIPNSPASIPAAPKAAVTPGVASSTDLTPNTSAASTDPFDDSNTGVDTSSVPPDVLLHAKKMIQGLAPYPNGFQTKQPFYQQALTTAEKLDPSYDFTTAPTRVALNKGFANGKQGEQIKTSNRAISHMSELLDAGNALNNSNTHMLGVTLYNKGANALSASSGENPTTNFNTVVNRVVPEIASAYVAGGGTGKERGADKGDFDTGMTPDQLHGTVSETGKLLYAQTLENARQYVNNAGPYAAKKQFLTPNSLKVLKKLGVDTSEVEQLQGASPDKISASSPTDTPADMQPQLNRQHASNLKHMSTAELLRMYNQ